MKKRMKVVAFTLALGLFLGSMSYVERNFVKAEDVAVTISESGLEGAPEVVYEFSKQDDLNVNDIQVNEDKTLVDTKVRGGEYRIQSENNMDAWTTIDETF